MKLILNLLSWALLPPIKTNRSCLSQSFSVSSVSLFFQRSKDSLLTVLDHLDHYLAKVVFSDLDQNLVHFSSFSYFNALNHSQLTKVAVDFVTGAKNY